MTAIPTIEYSDAAMEAERSMLESLLGPSGVADILAAVESTVVSDPAALQQAVTAKDRENTSRWAHRIKGGFSSLGAKRLCALYAQLETEARSAEWSTIESLHAEASAELQRVVEVLHTTWR